MQDQGLVENLLKSVWIVHSSKSSASQLQDLLMNSCGALKKQMTRLWRDSNDWHALFDSRGRPDLTA